MIDQFLSLHDQEFTCDINSNNFSKPSIETRLVSALRRWVAAAGSSVAIRMAAEKEISDLLEWYIGQCLVYAPNSLRGWWSDGVIHLKVTQTSAGSLKLLGVTWIDSHGFAPFEIDVTLNPVDKLQFSKTVFRIGSVDGKHRPKLFPDSMAPARILEMRPRCNQNWAMAVELTPPESNATER